MIYSDKEIKNQLEALYIQCDSLGLSQWDFEFINSIYERDFKSMTDKQKQMISKIYLKHLD